MPVVVQWYSVKDDRGRQFLAADGGTNSSWEGIAAGHFLHRSDGTLDPAGMGGILPSGVGVGALESILSIGAARFCL